MCCTLECKCRRHLYLLKLAIFSSLCLLDFAKRFESVLIVYYLKFEVSVFPISIRSY